MAAADKAQPRDWPKLQNFKVHKLLGTGSYGKVYKVQRANDDQFYALKEIDLASLDQIQRNDAVNEIRLLCSINHENVTRYHEAFVSGSKLYVVMEYAPFGELRYYIEKAARNNTPFPEECVWRLFLQLAKGLAALHSQQIIHRDIKPANVFLCANDLLKIGDLGIAKALTNLSFTRTQVGTPLYMAPEVWARKPYGYPSDLWSLGCLLYEMMALLPPFRARSQQELQMRIMGAQFTPIQPGTYSPELIAFANALLDVDPRKRPTADQILSSPAAARWLRVVPPPRRPSEAGLGPIRAPSEDGGLIGTILVPRDIRQLPRVLPPPSYDTDGNNRANLPASQGPSPRVSNAGAAPRPPLVPTPNGAPPSRLAAPPPPPPANAAAAAAMAAARRRMSDNGGVVAAGGRASPVGRLSENGAPRSSGATPVLPPIPSRASGVQLPPIDQRAGVPMSNIRPPARRVTCS